MRLSRAFHAMKTDTRACARGLGLGPGQPRILSYLAAHGVSTQREIAKYLVIDPSAVSRMLDALERGGNMMRELGDAGDETDALVAGSVPPLPKTAPLGPAAGLDADSAASVISAVGEVISRA